VGQEQAPELTGAHHAAVWSFLGLDAAWATFVHTDDTDAGLYRAVVRNMVADGARLELRYLPSVVLLTRGSRRRRGDGGADP